LIQLSVAALYVHAARRHVVSSDAAAWLAHCDALLADGSLSVEQTTRYNDARALVAAALLLPRAASAQLDLLVCPTLSVRHYNREAFRWQSAVEPWSFQLKVCVDIVFLAWFWYCLIFFRLFVKGENERWSIAVDHFTLGHCIASESDEFVGSPIVCSITIAFDCQTNAWHIFSRFNVIFIAIIVVIVDRQQ
jgi:hypothetical protein